MRGAHSGEADMRRRDFVRLVGGAALLPIGVRAQPTDRVPRIGLLFVNTAEQERALFGDDPFGFRDLGYVEGETIAFERRYADGNLDRLAAQARELAALNVDVIVTGGPGVDAAHRATTIIPIVAGSSGDLVAQGYAASLAHPDGNITGSGMFSPELMAKRLELLKEVVPSLTRAGVLLLADYPASRRFLEAMEPMARSLNVELLPIETTVSNGYEDAFSTVSGSAIGGMVISEPAPFQANAARIASLANKRGVPTIGWPAMAASGALLGYGASNADLFRRAAIFVRKILAGAKPGDIPIEQPTKFRMIVNLKTAKAIGVEIPPLLLAGADEVIE
jgi:putative ABC transport system substrate-binding protein